MRPPNRHALRPRAGLLRPLVLLVLGLYATGCAFTTPRVGTLAEVTQGNAKARSRSGLPICGYTDARGVKHEFTGYLRELDPDSLEITIRGERFFERVTPDSIIPGGFYPDARLVVPRDSVITVCCRHFDRGKAALAVLGVAAAVAGAWGEAAGEAAGRGVAETLGKLPPVVP